MTPEWCPSLEQVVECTVPPRSMGAFVYCQGCSNARSASHQVPEFEWPLQVALKQTRVFGSGEEVTLF